MTAADKISSQEVADDFIQLLLRLPELPKTLEANEKARDDDDDDDVLVFVLIVLLSSVQDKFSPKFMLDKIL